MTETSKKNKRTPRQLQTTEHYRVNAPYHTKPIFGEEFQATVRRAARSLLEARKSLDFNVLAATGNSGLPLIGALSYITGIPMAAVRKAHDGAHDTAMVNGIMPLDMKYVIVDDLISSGRTIQNIVQKMRTGHEDQWNGQGQRQLVGIYLYNSDWSADGKQFHLYRDPMPSWADNQPEEVKIPILKVLR